MNIEELRRQEMFFNRSSFLGDAPTGEKPRRVILNTDAHNEIDDQMAIVHALLSPELKIEGIVAAHYGTHTHSDSMERSYNEALHLLDLMGMGNRVKVLKGTSVALSDRGTPQKSEGAEFIIDCAKSSPEPLYVAFLGPLSDMASAYLLAPEIAENVVALWIGGGWWPTGGPEFNAFNDWIAVDVVFSSLLPLVQYPRGTYRMMRVGVAEMERFVMGKGAVGDYLVSLFKSWRVSAPYPRKWWVYGDSPAVGTMINPQWGYYTKLAVPRFRDDLSYESGSTSREFEVCVEVTAGEIFADFFDKLEDFAQKNNLV